MKKFLPYVNVYSVKEYFDLPLNEREKWGLYLKPLALPLDGFGDESGEPGWDAFAKEIRKHYPIQGFIREWFFTYDNPVYRFFGRLNQKRKDIKYAIKHFISPACPRYRAVYPRHKWIDLVEVIRESNFAIILDFWYEEMKDQHTYWKNSKDDPERAEFYDWISNSVQWIEKDRSVMEKKIDQLYDVTSHSKTYEENYGEINRIEKSIDEQDTAVLTQMIKYRMYFWT